MTFLQPRFLQTRLTAAGLAALVLLGGFGRRSAASDAAPSAPAPSFTRDVMAVLSKAGCNMGACHGNQNGKGGLRLSLRGEDPALDYQRLTREFAGRRLNLIEPRQSLLLQKPSGRAPHEGGMRLPPDSRLFAIVHDWIAAGAPPAPQDEDPLVELLVEPASQVVQAGDPPVALRVTARFASGAACDVTDLAVYEPATSNVVVSPQGVISSDSPGEATVLVRYLNQQRPVWIAWLPAESNPRTPAAPPANFIDLLVRERLSLLRMTPAQPCDDTVFVRRAFLDAIGLPPTADEARAFAADDRPDKRARLIDSLLARPEFAEHWALKWSDLLRNEEKVLDDRGVSAFYDWIRRSIQQGLPIDAFVRQLVSARGSTYDYPPANYYRANRDPFTRAETTARLFLGVRLGCAKCHNHPFDRWTQEDYYSWASLFAGVDYLIVRNDRRDDLDKNEFNGEQVVFWRNSDGVVHPRSGQRVGPRFLGQAGDASPSAGDFPEDIPEDIASAQGVIEPPGPPPSDRLNALAAWLASPDNRMFVDSQANFLWHHLFGRGLVEPLDDFRITNPPSIPALLTALGDELVRRRFDLRTMLRIIMLSQTWQAASSVELSGEMTSDGAFAHTLVRRLTAEQLLDAQCQVLGAPSQFVGYPVGFRAGQMPGVRRLAKGERRRGSGADGDRFLKVFGKPERLLACECERSNETTLSQALLLLGDESLQERLSQPENRLGRWLASGLSSQQIAEELYWTALSRPPTEVERSAAVELLESGDRRQSLEDLAWALLNAKEFIFRR